MRRNNWMVLALALSAAMASMASAHEGHGVTPGAVPANHGGIAKATSELFVEAVQTPAGADLYFTDHDSKPVALKDIKLSVKASSRKAKSLPVQVKERNEASPIDSRFELTVDPQGAVQYSLEVTATYKGKAGKVRFSIEPQG